MLEKFHPRGAFREKIKGPLLEMMKLTSSDIVIDVGSGDGFYSNEFSKVCKQVFSIDEYCKNFESGFYSSSNITTICIDACQGIDIPKATHAFFLNSFHDMKCQDQLLSFLSSILKDEGKLTLVEFKLDAPFGPPKAIRFSEDELVEKIESRGFKKIDRREFEYHYAVSFVKK